MTDDQACASLGLALRPHADGIAPASPWATRPESKLLRKCKPMSKWVKADRRNPLVPASPKYWRTSGRASSKAA